MKNFTRPSTALAAITLTVGLPLGSINAPTLVRASAFVSEGNQETGIFLGTFDSTSTPLKTVQGVGGSSHDLTGVGGSGTLIYNGQAEATASYNSLKASASGSLTNSFFDENYDPEAEEQTGVPSAYFAQGSARFSQTLQYGGTATNYTSTYALKLTGTISGSGRASVVVGMQHADQPEQTWFFNTSGDYDILLYSQAYIHGNSPQTFALRLSTLYSFDTDTLAQGGSFSGNAEFGNTLEVVGIELRDETGTLRTGSIISDTGQNFNIIVVPEPSSLFLTSLGLSAACLVRRRRK